MGKSLHGRTAPISAFAAAQANGGICFMRRKAVLKLSAFLVALLLCTSSGLTSAFAAGDTDMPALPTQAAQASQETPDEKSPAGKFKEEIIRLVNVEREKAGVAALEDMSALDTMADVRASESAVAFSHTRPDGTRCFSIFAQNAMKYRAAGENLAFGFSTPEAAVNAWMNSPTHKRNILDPDFKYIGIGYYDNGQIFCSELFYTPKP
jgi:uncharacterized protein YkwD